MAYNAIHPRIAIDFEGFRGSNGQLIVKELSCLDIDNNRLLCLTFKPPPNCLWRYLNNRIKITNKYIEDKIHGLPYHSGICEYSELYSILKDIAKNNCTLYSKGSEKCKLLSSYCGKYVHDLDHAFAFVKIEDFFQHNKVNVSCFNPHKVKNNHCSVKKVYCYKQMILSNDNACDALDELNAYFSLKCNIL